MEKQFVFENDPTVLPEDLVGNINLALHHHMAPPGETNEGDEEDFSFEPQEDVNPTELVGNINLALHHHMAPPGELEDENK